MQTLVSIIKGALMTIGVIALTILFANLLGDALEKDAKAECLKWQEWATVYPEWDEASQTGYYLTHWQDKQCKALKINIEAHVINPNN